MPETTQRCSFNPVTCFSVVTVLTEVEGEELRTDQDVLHGSQIEKWCQGDHNELYLSTVGLQPSGHQVDLTRTR